MQNSTGSDVKGIGYAQKRGWFSFSPNGSSNPTAASITGPLKRFITSITYSATGVQTIVFTSEFKFAQTPVFQPVAKAASLATAYDVIQTGAYNTTTRTLVLQQYGQDADGVPEGVEVAANAAAVVTVYVDAQDTTGK